MTVDEYLYGIIANRSNNYSYTQAEEQAYSKMAALIKAWADSIKAYDGIYGFTGALTVELQKSGSRAKGTAIKGKSDIDIFVSITDRKNIYTIENLYESLYDYLKQNLASTNPIRKQNVSIGIKYAGCEIDVTPGKRYNGNYYMSNGRRYDDHWIYSRKNDARRLTNIQKHIDLVRGSGLRNEMMLLKIWRNQNNVELPSIYLEIFTPQVLRGAMSGSISTNFEKLLTAIKDTVQTRKIVDPSNSTNIISDGISPQEKLFAKRTAEKSLSLMTEDWRKVIW